MIYCCNLRVTVVYSHVEKGVQMAEANGKAKVFKVSSGLHQKVEKEADRKKRTIRAHLEDILEKHFARQEGRK